jgi:hypothetical protein
MPLARGAAAAVQRRDDRVILVKLYGAAALGDIAEDQDTLELSVDDFYGTASLLPPATLQKLFSGQRRWAGYVAGGFPILGKHKKITRRTHGANNACYLDLPAEAGVAASAALVCATLWALTAAYHLILEPLEVALLADGVPGDKLYPLDVDRAFRKLDQIKPHIDVWWTSYPQTTQLLQSGEVDMIVTSNARAQAAADGGTPVTLIWNQALYGLEGWVIPKGTPRAVAAKKFIAFCARPKQQALYTKTLSYGPTNPKAFESIAAARAEQLPTAPDHFKLMVPVVDEWWGANKDAMYARYNAWLLK